MIYPEYFTADDIMEFEYEYARYLGIEQGEGDLWAINAECQIVAQIQQEEAVDELYEDLFHDELERDHDESYEPELNDSWYEDQYDIEYA